MADTAYFITEPASAAQKYRLASGAICKRLINFTTGQAGILHQHQAGLGELLGQMAASGNTVYIIGHASRQGHGSFDNKNLSERRAKEVMGWFRTRIDTVANSFEVHGEADTETIGTTPNDAKDRAVVLIVQAASAPRPHILPPIDPYQPADGPDVPLKPDIPWPFRRSGWKIDNVTGTTLTVPVPIKGLSVGGAVMNVRLIRIATGEAANYRLIGTAGSFDPTSQLAFAKKLTKVWDWKPGASYGPNDAPGLGSELLVSSWVPEPVNRGEFAHFAYISGAGASVIPGVSGNLMVLSGVPFNVPVFAEASVTAIGVFAGAGISIPGVSVDTFTGTMDL